VGVVFDMDNAFSLRAALVAVFILAGLGAAAVLVRAQASADQDLTSVLRQRLGSHPGAGIVVGLLDEHGVRSYQAAGRASEARPFDARPETEVFEIGSVSKVFTATILAEMVRKGDVRLDDPVSTYLPASVRMPERNGKPITLLALATHTSGLPRLPDNLKPGNPDNPYADYSVQQLYEFLSRHQLARDVGERYEYSNLGVGLLGHVLALRAGKGYEALLLERVTRSLGMKDTAITLGPGLLKRLAAGHAATGYAAGNWDIPTLAGAGAIRSTAADMLTFLAAQLAAPDGPLGPAMADTHLARATADRPGMETGLAWVIRTSGDARVLWHNGGTGGYHSFVGFNPKRHTAVVVLHNSAMSIDDIGFHLLDPAFALDAKAPSLQKPRVEVALGASALDALVGSYALTPAFVIAVTREGGQLFIQATGQQRLPAFPESETTFFLKAVDAQITFERDAVGRVTTLVLHQNGMNQRAKRQ
jgi:serine-type D-Ala-D-Ala carboxypeptidase/endopeptidase